MIRIYTDASASHQKKHKPGFAAVVVRGNEVIDVQGGIGESHADNIIVTEAQGVLVAQVLLSEYKEGGSIVTDNKIVSDCAKMLNGGSMTLDEVLIQLSRKWKIAPVWSLKKVVSLMDVARGLGRIPITFERRASSDGNTFADMCAKTARDMGNDPDVPDSEKYYWLNRIREMEQLNQAESV